eukprot:sb/3466421/
MATRRRLSKQQQLTARIAANGGKEIHWRIFSAQVMKLETEDFKDAELHLKNQQYLGQTERDKNGRCITVYGTAQPPVLPGWTFSAEGAATHSLLVLDTAGYLDNLDDAVSIMKALSCTMVRPPVDLRNNHSLLFVAANWHTPPAVQIPAFTIKSCKKASMATRRRLSKQQQLTARIAANGGKEIHWRIFSAQVMKLETEDFKDAELHLKNQQYLGQTERDKNGRCITVYGTAQPPVLPGWTFSAEGAATHSLLVLDTAGYLDNLDDAVSIMKALSCTMVRPPVDLRNNHSLLFVAANWHTPPAVQIPAFTVKSCKKASNLSSQHIIRLNSVAQESRNKQS